MNYTHLTEDDRYDIYERKGRGEKLREISAALGRNKSTISRELRRNVGGKSYRPKQAQEMAKARLKQGRGGRKVYSRALRRCRQLLRTGYSPAQATGRAQKEGYAAISHEWLYGFIYADKANGGTLWQSLRCRKQRRKRYATNQRRRLRIPNRIGIEERCPRVEKRATVGHWEGDTVMGENNKTALITLVERNPGYAIVRKLKSRRADDVAAEIVRVLKPLRNLVRTITFDNGLEFSRHEYVREKLGVKVFSADPYSAWQRGTNENWNGLLRQYFPKRTCFAKVTETSVARAQRILNDRARKRLAWCSPHEILLPSARRAGVALAL